MQIDSSASGSASSIYDELRSGKSSSSLSLQDADASSSTSNASGATLSLSDILGQRARLRAQMEQNGQMGLLQSNLGNSSSTGDEDADSVSTSASEQSSSSSSTASASNASMTSNVGQMFMPPPPQGVFGEEGMQSDSGEGMFTDMFGSTESGTSSSSLGASAIGNYWLRQRASSAYEGIDSLIGGQSSNDSQAVSLDA